MENQSGTDIRYDVYIDSIKDEEARKRIIMFLAGIVKHIQLEEIISGVANLPFKVVSAVTEETALKLQERLGVRGATVRLVQLLPGTVPANSAENFSEPRAQQESSPAPAPAIAADQQTVQPVINPINPGTPETASFIKRLWTSWVDVMFNSTAFFRSINADQQIPFPVLFGIIWGTIAILLNLPTVLATQQTYIRFFSGGMQSSAISPFSSYTSVLIMAPFSLFILVFVLAGVYHLFILLVGGKGGFRSTLKVVAYSTGAMVLEVIPYIGVPLFWFYSLYLYTIGFRELHKISTARGFVAAILPVVFLIFFFIAIIVLLMVGFGFNFLRQYRPQIPGIPI